MNARQRQHLLDAKDAEPTDADYRLSKCDELRMKCTRDRVHPAASRADAESTSSDRQQEIPEADADDSVCTIAPAWLKHAECA